MMSPNHHRAEWWCRTRTRFIVVQVMLGALFGAIVGVRLGHADYVLATLSTVGAMACWRFLVYRRHRADA
jgi:hypothetical protein